MDRRRKILSITAGLTLLGSTVLVTTPSYAAAASGFIQDNSNGTVTVTYNQGSPAAIVDLLICSAGTVSCGFGNRLYALTTSGAATLGTSPVLIQEGTVVRRPAGTTASLPSGNYVFSLVGTISTTTTPIDANVAVTIGSGGGGSSSSSTPAPAVFEMTFAPADGTVCTTRSESATVGSWIGLPTANQCTPPAARPNAKLLGWATTPDFPLSIAQRQVDNGWGAYEIFNNEGRLTAVFIPAGRATQVSSPASLYPIWRS